MSKLTIENEISGMDQISKFTIKNKISGLVKISKYTVEEEKILVQSRLIGLQLTRNLSFFPICTYYRYLMIDILYKYLRNIKCSEKG